MEENFKRMIIIIVIIVSSALRCINVKYCISQMKRKLMRIEVLTGLLLKKTNDVRVRMNQRFFHDFHPSPEKQICKYSLSR